MKLGKKFNIIKPLLIILFMFFVCFKTMEYLYKNNDITNEEYIKILLSDSYKNTNDYFFINIIKLLSKKINPTNMLVLTNKNNYMLDEYNYEKLKVYSKHIIDLNKDKSDKPLVYIYNTHQLENYNKKGIYAYNITPNVMMASYLLKENLKKYNIDSIVLDENIKNKNNYFDISRDYLLSVKKTYPSIKYYIDIHRSNIVKNISTIKIDNVSYARTYFIIGEDKNNYENATILSSKLNEKYPGISRGISKKEDIKLNQDIDHNIFLIEFGGIENTIDEVMNTIEAFSLVFNEYIGVLNET